MPTDAALCSSHATESTHSIKLWRAAPSAATFFITAPSTPLESAAGAWMGHERKRGNSAIEFLLRGNSQGFSVIVGNTEALTQVKYVITLDTDTQLPRDSARQLIGVMAHPLNHPQFDRPPFQADSEQTHAPRNAAASRRIVTAGYGILQPRVAVSLPGTRRSPYARLYSGEPGLDPYTRTVSDVYQDAFGEGSLSQGHLDVSL